MRKIPTRGSFASAVALCIVAVVAIVFFFRAAETLLIPIALAVLISYALAPVMSWLERHRVRQLAPVAGKRYRVCSTVYGGFGSDSGGGSSTGSGGGSSVGVGGAGGVFGIGRGLFGSGGVGGTSICARIKSRPLCCARLSCSLIERLQTNRILSIAFDSPP
jgi:uncharacterized membrane protein YgcG